MSEQENTKLAAQAYTDFKAGNIQGILDAVTDDVDWELPEIENVPYSGQRQGRENVAEFFSQVNDLLEALELNTQDFIAQGDKVVVLGNSKWRVKTTGREIGGNFAHVFTIRNGKITAFQEFMDTAVVAAAFQKAASA